MFGSTWDLDYLFMKTRSARRVNAGGRKFDSGYIFVHQIQLARPRSRLELFQGIQLGLVSIEQICKIGNALVAAKSARPA
jgi:hypothetical protein